MYDFDVLRESALDDDQPGVAQALGTIVMDASIGELPRAPALSLAPETKLAVAIEAMRRWARPAVVVVQQQRPLGVVTERDVAAQASAGAAGFEELSLADVMTACPTPLRATDTVGAAFRSMCALRQWHLPVVCGQGLLVGALDITDVCLWLRDRMTLVSLEAALGQ
jgi:CBS domain-containing protein